tara:strand:- start:3603 stop:4661 length:1059 start_codon:yes stop_codon:yes gene_type:complete
MSRIRANKITNKAGTGAVELEKGAHLPTGIGITGAGGLNITGVITATSFSGSGANLTGIDATSIKDSGGNVKIQAQASGAVYTGIHTFTTLNATTLNPTTVNATSLNATSGSFTGNVSIGGTLTYEDVTNIDSVGLVTAREGIFLPDDKKILIGNTAGSPDLQIFHSAGNSFISHNSSNNLKIQASDLILADVDGTEFFHGKNNAGVDLKHNGNIKLATTNTGITVTGTVAATSFSGDGSQLTNVGFTTEALTTAGATVTIDLSKDEHKITKSGTYTITCTGGSEGSSHTLRIVNSGTSNVSFSNYFLFPSGGTPALPTASGAISMISFTVHRAGAVGINTQLLAGASVNFS